LGIGERRTAGSSGEWQAKRWRWGLSRRRDSKEDEEELPSEQSSLDGLEEESSGVELWTAQEMRR